MWFCCSGLAQTWCRSGSCVVPVWFKFGSKLVHRFYSPTVPSLRICTPTHSYGFQLITSVLYYFMTYLLTDSLT